jgi:hypothetical protein
VIITQRERIEELEQSNIDNVKKVKQSQQYISNLKHELEQSSIENRKYKDKILKAEANFQISYRDQEANETKIKDL